MSAAFQPLRWAPSTVLAGQPRTDRGRFAHSYGEETDVHDVHPQPAGRLGLRGGALDEQDNRLLDKFPLDGVSPAPRSAPQIEVPSSIDANGILNVSTQDRYTEKGDAHHQRVSAHWLPLRDTAMDACSKEDLQVFTA